MTTRRKKPDIIIEAAPTAIASLTPEPTEDYQAANDGLSAMMNAYMRENERLRAFLHVLVLRGDSIGKAAKLILEQPDMTAETLTRKGIL